MPSRISSSSSFSGNLSISFEPALFSTSSLSGLGLWEGDLRDACLRMKAKVIQSTDSHMAKQPSACSQYHPSLPDHLSLLFHQHLEQEVSRERTPLIASCSCNRIQRRSLWRDRLAKVSRCVQDLSAELAAAREKAERMGEAAEKHQKGVAKLTADNVVQLLRLRQCEVGILNFQ